MKTFALNSKVGKIGELLAKKYLTNKGHEVLAENYYFEKGKRSGEIDIITLYKGSIYFIEVKTRTVKGSLEKSTELFSTPESKVTPSKLKKCAKTAEHYLRATKRLSMEHHFGVVAVLYNEKEKKAQIRYLQDVFY